MENNFGDIAVAAPPGISWTAPAQSRAWLRPPAEVDVTALANQYMTLLASPQAANDTLDALETKVPIAVIAETIMLTGVSKGIHTIDAGVLVMPVIMETLKTIADMHDIETVMFPSELDEGTIHPRIMRKMMEAIKTMSDEQPAEEPMVEEKPATGLMARKMKEGV